MLCIRSFLLAGMFILVLLDVPVWGLLALIAGYLLCGVGLAVSLRGLLVRGVELLRPAEGGGDGTGNDDGVEIP